MKRPDEGDERFPAQELLRPFPHLAGRLVRERHRRDRARVHAARNQMRQPVRDDPRLPGSCSGEDEERALLVEDGLALFGVETL